MTYIGKCDRCGGTLASTADSNIGECEYCGTKQVFRRIDTDRRERLYERADHFRLGNDYDRAISVYNEILNEDPDDAEAYWSIVLCKYGVQYVKDPASGKTFTTCNRTQYASVFADEDYKKALSKAVGNAKDVYTAGANEIDSIQKRTLDLCRNEKPYDVFICYKDNDGNGGRTRDSVLAQEIYDQLTAKNLKVFFSRISLLSRLGQEYEPYIFSALNSAKVMLIVTTSAANVNSVWVKNEWSRFLALKAKDQSRLMIVAYRDMDPYELPNEFSYLQALDMSRIGFVQDLVLNIAQVAGQDNNTPKSKTSKTTTFTGTKESAVKYAYMCLEDKDFSKAKTLAGQVLDADPECADAHIISLCARVKASSISEIGSSYCKIDGFPEYSRAMQFANDKQKQQLTDTVNKVKSNTESFIEQVTAPLTKVKEDLRDINNKLASVNRKIDSNRARYIEMDKRRDEIGPRSPVFPVKATVFAIICLVVFLTGSISKNSAPLLFTIGCILGVLFIPFAIVFLAKIFPYIKNKKNSDAYTQISDSMTVNEAEYYELAKEKSGLEVSSAQLESFSEQINQRAEQVKACRFVTDRP